MRILRTLTGVMLLGGALLVAAPASPVAAASPNCNSHSNGPWRTPSGRIVSADLPTFGSGDIACILGQGNTGVAVEVLQIALNECNNAALQTDGIYGPKTRDTVKFIQVARGITGDGVYGPQTLQILDWPSPDLRACTRIRL